MNVLRFQIPGNQGQRLARVVRPVVVGHQKRAIAIAQLQRWIRQWIGYSCLGKAWAQAPQDNRRIAGVLAQDKTCDHDVAPGADKCAGADVGQPRKRGGVQVIRFNQAYASGVIFAPDDRGIGSDIEGGNDGGFEIIGGRNPRSHDRGFLGIPPIVVGNRDETIWSVQLQHGVSQRTRDTGLSKRRPDGTDKHLFGHGSGDDESADADILVGQNSHPSG